MLEQWVNIYGYDNKYSISNLGRVLSNSRMVNAGSSKRLIHAKELKTQIGYGGYKCVYLRKPNSKKNTCHYIHRLVATHFIDNHSNKPFINHIDGDKLNNNYSNLEWVTKSENSIHALNNGLSIPLHKRYITPVSYNNKGSIQVVIINEGVVESIYGSIKEASNIIGVATKVLNGLLISPIKYKNYKLYGFKLHKIGITWDQVQEYIGRPESSLSEMLSW